jgi:hypothetical protein
MAAVLVTPLEALLVIHSNAAPKTVDVRPPA